MVKIYLKWCISGYHSGYPICYDTNDSITFGDIKQYVININNEWYNKGWSQNKFTHVEILDNNNKFIDSNTKLNIYAPFYNNEIYLVYDAI